VTPIAHNCNKTQWEGLNFKNDIVVNVDVFNRILVTQLPKVALDYEAVLCRYCRTRKFYFLIYDVLKYVLIITTMIFKYETVFLLVLASPVHPQDNSLRISKGTQTFTLLVIFLVYYDKVFTKMNNMLYTRSLNILSRCCITVTTTKRFLFIAGCINIEI